MDLQYNSLCCESCISKIKTALLKMPDVESVSVDMYANRVSVTGRVPPPKLLQVSSKMSPNKVITLIPADSESEINLLPVAEEMSMLEFNSTASPFPATP
jgi:copper chaperone CopZ